jgi:hypothetical protein
LEVADAVTELCAVEEREEDATRANTADLTTADVK